MEELTAPTNCCTWSTSKYENGRPILHRLGFKYLSFPLKKESILAKWSWGLSYFVCITSFVCKNYKYTFIVQGGQLVETRERLQSWSISKEEEEIWCSWLAEWIWVQQLKCWMLRNLKEITCIVLRLIKKIT